MLEERADRQKDDVKGEAKSGSRKEQANERTVISRNNRGSRQLQDEALSLSLSSLSSFLIVEETIILFLLIHGI